MFAFLFKIILIIPLIPSGLYFADGYLNDNNTLSIYTTQNWFDGLATGSTIVRNNGVLLTNAPTISESESNSSAYNFNYKLDFDKKDHNIEFEANFSNSKSPEVAEFNELINPSDKSLNYNNSVTNNRDNTLLNLDYTNPVSKNGKLELGAEVRINKTSNSIITDQENLNNSSFNYDRNIFSSYITYSHKFNKITMQVGARLEQYEIEGNFVNGTSTAMITDDIFTVYPSAFFT
jgi:hypothetical protein